MTPSGVVTLLTDFGLHDPFVGVMKGVMLAQSPRLSIVDLSHAIEPQRVGDAAFWLARAHGWFPEGTVHVAVVDPGVGTERAAVVARAGAHWFVAPDNGILEVILRRSTDFEAREIEPERLGLRVASRTFHGRDLFAPVGALLAAGALRFESVGPERVLCSTSHVPEPRWTATSVEGSVVVIDRFGNLITSIVAGGLPVAANVRVSVGAAELAVVGTYADVQVGELGALVGSFGDLELFVRNGSAAQALAAERGTPVRVSW